MATINDSVSAEHRYQAAGFNSPKQNGRHSAPVLFDVMKARSFSVSQAFAHKSLHAAGNQPFH
jgi:hypothetical protein